MHCLFYSVKLETIRLTFTIDIEENFTNNDEIYLVSFQN